MVYRRVPEVRHEKRPAIRAGQGEIGEYRLGIRKDSTSGSV
jgi:hypothetical protein